MSRALGIAERTMYMYLHGTYAIPGTVILAAIVRYNISHAYLLHGTGPMFKEPASTDSDGPDKLRRTGT